MRMQRKNLDSENNDETTITISKSAGKQSVPRNKSPNSSHIVTADSVQAEEVPTIPLSSLQTLSALEPEVAVRSVTTTDSVHLPPPLVVQPSEYQRDLGEWLQFWWEGIRPTYVLLAILPVLLGTLLAWVQTLSSKTPFGLFHWQHFLGTLVVVIALQTGANLVNDYYDYIRGIDTGNSLGPGGLIQQGFIRPTHVLNVGLVCLLLGGLLGAIVAFSGGPFVYLFGIIGLLGAFFYSATSRALSSIVLGELASFIIYGPLLTFGAYMVQAGGPPYRTSFVSILLYSLLPALLTTAVVHVNNMRDIETDTQARKLTLASLLGLRWSRVLYVILVLGVYPIVAAIGFPHGAPHLVLITFWTLPTLVVALSGVLRADMPASLHLAMRETLKLSTYFALLLIAALLITALWAVLSHLPTNILPI